jgi:predicted nucleic-acid-binding protein
LKELLIDTNVIIRLLSGDHEQHSPAARKLFALANEGKYRLWIHSMVIAECCYVLEGKYYGYDRQTIARHLISLLQLKGVKCFDAGIVSDALECYARTDVDFVDAYLAVLQLDSREGVVTFNSKDFAKSGCVYFNPLSLLGITVEITKSII